MYTLLKNIIDHKISNGDIKLGHDGDVTLYKFISYVYKPIKPMSYVPNIDDRGYECLCTIFDPPFNLDLTQYINISDSEISNYRNKKINEIIN